MQGESLLLKSTVLFCSICRALQGVSKLFNTDSACSLCVKELTAGPIFSDEHELADHDPEF